MAQQRKFYYYAWRRQEGTYGLGDVMQSDINTAMEEAEAIVSGMSPTYWVAWVASTEWLDKYNVNWRGLYTRKAEWYQFCAQMLATAINNNEWPFNAEKELYIDTAMAMQWSEVTAIRTGNTEIQVPRKPAKIRLVIVQDWARAMGQKEVSRLAWEATRAMVGGTRKGNES